MERPGRPPARAEDPERTGHAEPVGDHSVPDRDYSVPDGKHWVPDREHWVPDGVTPAGRPSEVRWTQRRPDRGRPPAAQADWPEPGAHRDGRPPEGVDLLLGQLRSGYMGSVTQTIDLSMLHRLLAQGMGNLQIARKLYLSEGAVKAHVSRLLTKLSCDNRVQAAILAHNARLVSA